MVGFKVYIVEIFGRNLSQILADEAEMIKPYSTHDQGISNFLPQKEIPEHLQQCSVCDPGEIFLTSKFSCLVFSNWAPIKLKLGLQIGERLLIENHLNKSLLVWPVPLAQVRKNHLKINISHILNPNLTKINSIKSCSSRSFPNTKGTFQFLWNFQLGFNLIFSEEIIQYSRTFAPQVQTPQNQAHAPLLLESFPKRPRRTRSETSPFNGSHRYKTKQTKNLAS